MLYKAEYSAFQFTLNSLSYRIDNESVLGLMSGLCPNKEVSLQLMKCYANVDRYSKFFQQNVWKEIFSVNTSKTSVLPAVCYVKINNENCY